MRIITLMKGQNPQLLGPAASPLAWAGCCRWPGCPHPGGTATNEGGGGVAST